MISKRAGICVVVFALFHYRHTYAVQKLLRFSVEFGEYLAYVTFEIISFLTEPTKYCISTFNQLSVFLVPWVSGILMVVRWFGQQILYGLLGWSSVGVAILSWVFVISCLHLYLCYKFFRCDSDDRVEQTNTRRIHHARQPEPEDQVINGQNYTGHRYNRVEVRNDQNSDRNFEHIAQTGENLRRCRLWRFTFLRRLFGGDNSPVTDQQQQNGGTIPDRNAETEPTDARYCVICYIEEKNTALFPCGHAQLCNRCVERLRRTTNKCPLCQTEIGEVRTVFI